MVNWNSGFNWNELGGETGGKGFFWNTDEWLIVINMHEMFKAKDDIGSLLARILMLEDIEVFEHELVLTALLQGQRDRFGVKEDDVTWYRIITMLENIGIKDIYNDLLVLLSLSEDFRLLDDTKLLAEIIQSEDINLDEIHDLYAFLDFAEKFELKEIEHLIIVLIQVWENIGITDREPRLAVSDFLIGNIDDLDRAYDWLIPFNLKIDWKNSQLDTIPEAELTKIQMPGIDGSIVEDSVYRDRVFNIVGYTQDGLTVAQREEIKRKLVRILDATKHQDKKLTIQAASTSFDVRYEGQAEIENGASYAKATIPLRAAPYGYPLFPTELAGKGLVSNLEGDAPLRPRHEITGPITNPTFSLGTITYRYSGTVPSGSILVIDQELMSAWVEDSHGNKTNALPKLTGEFQFIPVGESCVLNCSGETQKRLLTTWNIKILW